MADRTGVTQTGDTGGSHTRDYREVHTHIYRDTLCVSMSRNPNYMFVSFSVFILL